MNNYQVLASGGVERIGLDNAFIKVALPNGEKKQIMHDMPDHKEGVNFVFQVLLDKEIGALQSVNEIDAVGHRVVQGGDIYTESVLVTPQVEKDIEDLCELAPVHNPGHLRGIKAVDELMPNVPQVCVFDNAYYLKENSLILSATIEGRRIETIEVNLDTLKVVQSRGVCNKNTEYHDQIVSLVNANRKLIRQRMKATA